MSHTAESLQKAFKYLFPNEVPALKNLARMLPDNPVVVNIGAGAGTSGLAFMESREDLWLITIDIQDKASPRGCLEAEQTVIKDAGFTWHIRNEQYCMDSKEVGRIWYEWNRRKVDMVFVDGDHSYDGCKGDIKAWLPNIKADGIIAIHDYKKTSLYTDDYNPDKPHPDYPAPRPFPGIDKAVDEILVGKYRLIMRIDSLIAFEVQ